MLLLLSTLWLAFASASSSPVDLSSQLPFPEIPQAVCAWQVHITGRSPNLVWPDLQAIYHAQLVPAVTDDHVLRIRGTFPRVRYFSLQSYDLQTQTPIDCFSDFQLHPDPGSTNPYVHQVNSTGQRDTWTVHLTPRGDHGHLNELALCPKGTSAADCAVATALFVFTFYTSDPTHPSSNCFTDPPEGQPNPRYFGYTPPPTVEVRGYGFDSLDGQFEIWKPLPTCDQTQPTVVSAILDEFGPTLLKPPTAFQATANYNDNLVAAVPAAVAGTFFLKDCSYYVAVADQATLPSKYGEGRIVVKMRAKLPRTAQRTPAGPGVADYTRYDVRYYSVTTSATRDGQPSIDTLDDTKIVARSAGLPNSAFASSQYFTIVMAPTTSSTCGLYNPTADLFLTTSLNGQPQDKWFAMVRQLISRYERDGQADHSQAYATAICSTNTTDPVSSCSRPSNLQRTMQEFYPSFEYFVCNQNTGQLTPINQTLESTFV